MNQTTDNGSGSTYTCPMHPEITQGHPGMCPECGMNLVPQKGKHKDHDGGSKHAGHSTNIFKRKFWVSFVLSIPIVLYSHIVQVLLKWQPPQFPGSGYLTLILSSIIFFYGGWIFLSSAWREIRGRLPGMMTLISLAITAAYAWSVYVVFAGKGEVLFWELATLITIMLFGHWLEMRAVQGAKGALQELSKLLPDTAEVIRNGTPETVPLADLKENDLVLVRPGAKIPADGAVVDGMSDVNESIATGESKPVPKKPGSEVIAGTTNGDGSLTVKVTKIGEHTFLAGVMRLVAEAQASKSRLQMLSDKAALYLTAVAVVIGFGALASWLAAGAEAGFAVERLVAVLVIACPHALGLAIPLVASISTTKAAKNGFLVKQRMALEAARNIDVVLFDKTGTLTKGDYGVTGVWPLQEGTSEEEIITLAAAVDAHSEHPVAKAIVEKARSSGAQISAITNFARVPGQGAEAKMDGVRIAVGGSSILGAKKISLPSEADEANRRGETLVYLLKDGVPLGVIALADVIREESREAISALKAMGIKVAMMTGDAEDVAEWVSKELKIDQYFARVLPGDKAGKVKLLQSEGKKVAMVGDGVNDAPALTQADLGIAIGAGTNVAIESAGIILVKSDPRDIPKVIKLSRLTYRKMIQNLFWAAGYNVVAMPLAAGVLAPWGIMLQPAFAALLMSLSTVIVAANAVMLRKQTL